MRGCIWVLLGVSLLLVSGCCLYSEQEFGPQSVMGEELDDLIARYGSPDTIGGAGSHLVLGWNYQKGIQVLCLFCVVEKKSSAVVVDADTGKVLSTGSVSSGRAFSILSPFTMPIMSVETNK